MPSMARLGTLIRERFPQKPEKRFLRMTGTFVKDITNVNWKIAVKSHVQQFGYD